MNNGDRLTGKIQQIDAQSLRLLTEYGGEIALDWGQVKAVQSPEDIAVRDDVVRRDYLARRRPVGEGEDPFAGSQEAEVVAVNSIRVLRPTLKGNLDLGFNYKTASTRTEDYTAKLDTEFRHDSWRHNIFGTYLRKNDNNITTTNHYGANLATDRFLSERFFWQGRALYKRDQIEEVSRQAAIGTGPGYQLWDDETGAFSLSGLLGQTRYGYNDGGSDSFFAATLRWDYNRFLGGDRLEFYTTGELMRPLDNAVDVSIDAVVGLRYRMTDWLSWFVNYSRNQISGGRQALNEKRISTGLGVSW